MHIEHRDDKKELKFNKEVDTGRLIEELYDGVPKLKPVMHEDGSFDINLRIFTGNGILTLWVPEEISKEEISLIVENHLVDEEGEK